MLCHLSSLFDTLKKDTHTQKWLIEIIHSMLHQIIKEKSYLSNFGKLFCSCCVHRLLLFPNTSFFLSLPLINKKINLSISWLKKSWHSFSLLAIFFLFLVCVWWKTGGKFLSFMKILVSTRFSTFQHTLLKSSFIIHMQIKDGSFPV